jgi:hypothetical protein
VFISCISMKTKQEITDTYHESLHGALEQAHWEFSVGPDERVTSA